MMSFMLGAYWDARPDSLEKCTEDAGRFFTHLAAADPLLGRWFEPGRSRKDALRRKVDTSDPLFKARWAKVSAYGVKLMQQSLKREGLAGRYKVLDKNITAGQIKQLAKGAAK